MRSLSTRGRVAAFVALAVLALLVGIASSPTAVLSGGPVIAREPLVVSLQTAFWLGLAVDLVMTGFLIWALWPQGRRKKRRPGDFEWAPPEPPKVHWAVKLVLVLVAFVPLLAVIAAIILLRGQAAQLIPGSLPGLPGVSPAPGQPPASLPGSATGSALVWISLGVAASLIAVVAAWLWLRRYRPGAWEGLQPVSREGLSDALEESLERLRSDPDPRRAVIAAYSSMERGMERVGLPRRHFEAPLEFVARILSSVAGAESDARRLTDLFEVAKFSQHQVTEEMRSTAVMALSRIRAQLRARAAA